MIRYYLGYSDLSAGSYSALEGAMTVVSADGIARIVVILGRLDVIEVQIAAQGSRANLKKVEEIEFFEGSGIGVLYREGARLVRLLAALLGSAILQNPFGANTVGNAGRG